MYIHLGADIEVRKKTIVAIFDLDNTSISKITNEFFKRASKNNIVVNVSEEDLPRSYILTEEKGKQTLYISPISSQTLSKRANIFDLK